LTLSPRAPTITHTASQKNRILITQPLVFYNHDGN
jgi:hypothetical protein